MTTIYCRICGHKIQSSQPGEEAQAHVLSQMTTHLGSHQEQAVRLAKDLVINHKLLATYLLIKRYVRIPEDEKELLQSFEMNESCLLDLFGLEVATKETN